MQKKYNKYGENIEFIKKTLSLLTHDGGLDDLRSFRTKKMVLKRHFTNIFNSNILIDAQTVRTDLFKSFICRTIVELYKRKMTVPVFDIDSINKSNKAYKQKRNASMVKALLDYFIRESRYENILKESMEDMLAYGDRYLLPFLRKSKDGKRKFFGVRDIDGTNIILDPNSKNVQSESYIDRSQYFATTNIVPEKNLIDMYGDWILDYAQEGFCIDSDGHSTAKSLSKQYNTKLYEVLEFQDRSMGLEMVLIGSNAFPVLVNYDDLQDSDIPPEIKKLQSDPTNKVSWSDNYLYRDEFDDPVLTLTNVYTFFNPDSPRNWGLVDKTAVMQVIHEIAENMKMDNLLQRLDQVKYLVGGNDRTDKSLTRYRQEKRTNRYAVWNIPTALAAKSNIEPGVLKFEGLTAQEGTEITEGIYDLVKNATGTDPQQLEIQKNTAVTQTQIVNEASTEAVEEIAEQNVPQYEAELRTFLAFIIAHQGFGLKDKIAFTDYSEMFPEGNPNATITVENAAKQIKGYQFNVIIDRSSLTKKSKYAEREQLLEFLQQVNPQVTPEWFMHISQSIAKISGIELPDIDPSRIQQMTPTGGASQFSGDTAPMAQMNTIEQAVPTDSTPVQVNPPPTLA